LAISHVAKGRATAAVVVLWVGLVGPAWGQTAVDSKGPAPSLCAADVFGLAARLGSTEPAADSLELTQKLAFSGAGLDEGDLVAFEENKLFVYAVGDAGKSAEGPAGHAGAEPSSRFTRRLVLLKPAVLVVDDHVRLARNSPPGSPVCWQFRSAREPEVAGRRVRVPGSDGEIALETLLPGKVSVRCTRQGDGEQAEHVVEVVPEDASGEVRLIHVIEIRAATAQGAPARYELVEQEGQVQLTVSTADRTFCLTLPPARSAAGEIEILSAQGKASLARRVLPSGILPHGPQGTGLLERWDSRYRGGRPGWDSGRPSSTLKQAVRDGAVRSCRVVELGCGAGTNAIWLAQQGFDVTAIDIAPTALSQAEARARDAGVSVRWVLADVLAPPRLEPFDFVFDRGCYHGVRRTGAAQYVQSVRRLTRPGARVLILAGNANDPRKGGGPPRVKEEEIRGDFPPSFQVESLRETRFDSGSGDQEGALAWSILLRRKAEP